MDLFLAYFTHLKPQCSTEAATAAVVSLTVAALLVANKAAHARPNLCMRRTQWPFWLESGLRCVSSDVRDKSRSG